LFTRKGEQYSTSDVEKLIAHTLRFSECISAVDAKLAMGTDNKISFEDFCKIFYYN